MNQKVHPLEGALRGYEAPLLTLFEVTVERGFTSSPPPGGDKEDGGFWQSSAPASESGEWEYDE